MSLLLQPVRVATGSLDEKGCLVFDQDQRLISLLVQLSEEHEGEVGHWFFEVGFGPMDRIIPPSRTLMPRRSGSQSAWPR